MQVRFADYSLDTDARQLFEGPRKIHLSPKAFELLKVLVENRPRALSKQELLEKVWPGVYVSEASLARGVNEIRDAIDDHSRTDGFLQTVHGYGYRFRVDGVVELDPSDAGAPVCWLVGDELEFRLAGGEHIAGREFGLPIRLDSTKISRHHARVVVSGRAVSIEDLGSKNGTFVNGVRIDAVTPLNHGDVLLIGPVRLRFKLVNDPTSTETAIWRMDQS